MLTLYRVYFGEGNTEGDNGEFSYKFQIPFFVIRHNGIQLSLKSLEI